MRRWLLVMGVLVVVGSLVTGTARAASTTVALWNMNEKSGTTMQDTASGGSVADNGTLTNVTVGQPGASGTAYGFNGPTVSYVNVPSSSDLNPGSSSFTFSVTVNLTHKPSGDYDLLRKGLSTTTGGDYKTEIAGTGQAICEWRGSSATKTLIGGTALDNGVWHTISCTKKAGKVQLRVDGTIRASASVAIGSISNSSSLLLGAKTTSGGDQYQGLMDQTKITLG